MNERRIAEAGGTLFVPDVAILPERTDQGKVL